jgi:hypothetical protein
MPPAPDRSRLTRATYDLDTWSKAAMYRFMHCERHRCGSARAARGQGRGVELCKQKVQ